MPTKLETLRNISADLGFVREIERTTAEYNCPIHEVPLTEERVDTIGGWQAVIVCPRHDGTCVYDPNGEPIQIEPPETDEKTPAAAGDRSTGGF